MFRSIKYALFLSAVIFYRAFFSTKWHAPSQLPFLMDITSGLRCRMQRVTSYNTFVTLVTSWPEVPWLSAMYRGCGFLPLDLYLNATTHIYLTVSRWRGLCRLSAMLSTFIPPMNHKKKNEFCNFVLGFICTIYN